MAWTDEARRKSKETQARKRREANGGERLAGDDESRTALPLGYDDETEPEAVASEPEVPKRSRGRPSGAGRSRAKVDFSGAEQLLYAVHVGLASVLKAPELVISEEEAALIRGAAEKVARHYDMPDLPAKMIDWTNLVVALGTVYGTRVIAIQARLASERRSARSAA